MLRRAKNWLATVSVSITYSQQLLISNLFICLFYWHNKIFRRRIFCYIMIVQYHINIAQVRLKLVS